MQLFVIYFFIFCSFVGFYVRGLLFTYSSVCSVYGSISILFFGFYFGFLNKGWKGQKEKLSDKNSPEPTRS